MHRLNKTFFLIFLNILLMARFYLPVLRNYTSHLELLHYIKLILQNSPTLPCWRERLARVHKVYIDTYETLALAIET